MKLLLDEMFSPLLARELRSRGHDVVAIKERTEWSGLSDPAVLSLARTEQRAVVTNNLRDFRPLHAESIASAAGHFGMVFIPANVARTRGATGLPAGRLEELIRGHPSGLVNAEAWC